MLAEGTLLGCKVVYDEGDVDVIVTSVFGNPLLVDQYPNSFKVFMTGENPQNHRALGCKINNMEAFYSNFDLVLSYEKHVNNEKTSYTHIRLTNWMREVFTTTKWHVNGFLPQEHEFMNTILNHYNDTKTKNNAILVCRHDMNGMRKNIITHFEKCSSLSVDCAGRWNKMFHSL